MMKSFIRRYQWQEVLVGLLVIAVFIGTQLSPYFLNYLNLANSSVTFVPTALMGLGLFPIVVLGEIDISLTSTLAVSAVIYARCWEAGMPMIEGALISLVAAVVMGVVNGVLVAVAKLPSMAVTLGTMGAYRGAAYLIAGDAGINGISGDYAALGSTWIGYLPVPVLVFAIVAFVIWVIMARTNYGQYCYAIGNQAPAVKSAGISITFVKIMAYVLGATTAWLAGVVWAGQYASARGDNADGTIMLVLTIVVLGGVSIFGGSGLTSGVVLAVALLFVVQSAMSLANVPGTTQTLVSGLILLIAIVLPNLSRLKELIVKKPTTK